MKAAAEELTDQEVDYLEDNEDDTALCNDCYRDETRIPTPAWAATTTPTRTRTDADSGGHGHSTLGADTGHP